MPTPGQPGQRRTARNIGVGVVLAGVIVGTGIGVREQMQAPPEPVPLEVPAKALGGPLLRDGFEGEGQGAPVPPDACSGPLVRPAGFEAVPVTWAKMWSSKRPGAPQMAFPSSPGFPVGIGAGRWQYQITSFIPLPNTTGQIFFDPHQARPNEGEPMGRPADSMFLSVSPCPGDFRPNALRPWCAISANTGRITWTTKPSAGTPSCGIQALIPHYILVAPVNPDDGSVAGDYTCKFPDAAYCWVQATHRPL
jgi:hypothetical protein